MNLKPLSSHILIQPLEDEKMTKSGIVLPENADKKKQMRGKVIEVGPGKITDSGTRVPIGVKSGDLVIFKEPWSDDNKIDNDGVKLFIIDEDDVLAIIE